MHPYKRSARVSDLIREEIADIIMNKIKHKTLGFITVTGAKVSDDLRHATVYISVFNVEDSKKTIGKLNSSASFIKGELARRLKMRYVPSITFKIDEAIEYGRKIDKLLDDIKSEGSKVDEDEELF
ncbi:MAG TPA: 30S ribosome-binding factor RbfA [Nitrospirae bacterium]|nr:ribosome-binding factor A [bacterium BMS3Abin06]HDH12401.1 30S ribosome-binding factor RbfA [Nitrospirota bacterium]HDY99853.1 30S ribosome-binding factor RbfA [Nitrospirota bacterium]